MDKRVLIVDDVSLNRMLAIAFLKKLGWKTFEVDGGSLAINWLGSNAAVDLVLLDISMPDLSGEEVCLQIRANPDHAALKIVAYTAHAASADEERFLANGFDAVLIKPISIQSLTDTISRLFPGQ